MSAYILTGAPLNEVWNNNHDRVFTDKRAPGTKNYKTKKTTSSFPKKKKKDAESIAKSKTPSYACVFDKNPSPLCDMYTQGFNSSFDDIMDIYQRDTEYRKSHAEEEEEEEKIEEHPKYNNTEYDNDDPDSESDNDHPNDDANDSDSYNEPPTTTPITSARLPKSSKNPVEGFFHPQMDTSPKPRQALMELAMFVLAGVMLIFILETFVKLGMGMRYRRHGGGAAAYTHY